MALNKRQYTDGQTIITAANLNEIQDCIIAIEGDYVPKTRTVNGKALSSNISLTAANVGAVPTSRTINSKALTGNITLSAADVGAVPVSRTVNSKALSSNITLSASDVGAVPTSRKVNNKALSADITLTAADVSAVPTTRTVNGKALSSNITLNASNIPNDSSVTGTNVDDAIETLADGQVILASAISDKILYFNAQTVSAGSNTEILRITDSRINATTVVLEWQVVDPDNIKSSINWTSGAGYISFVGTCSAATTANVTLGNR